MIMKTALKTDTESAIILHCQRIPGLVALYLFGSVVRAEQTRDSDIDIAFLALKPFDNLLRWELAQEIALVLKKEIDLVDLNACSEVMRFQIISTGRLIYSTDDRYVSDFADKTYWLYRDLQDMKGKLYADIKQRGSVYG